MESFGGFNPNKNKEGYLETESHEGGRLNEDEALLAQKLATEHEGIKFSEQTQEKSMDFASELIEDLRSVELSLDGLDWELVRKAQGPEEVIEKLKEYAQSKGVDLRKVNEYLEDTKDEPLDGFSRAKKLAMLVSFLAATVVGGAPSESSAAPLMNQQNVQEYSPEAMATMDGAVMYKEGTGYPATETREYQKDYKSYFNEIKHNHPDIKDIQFSHILVSQKVVEETRHDKTFDSVGDNSYKQMVPAVVVDVEIKITTKDGHETVIKDKSYRNINTGYAADRHSPFQVAVEYAVKKGWISASNAAYSGAWKKDLRNKFQDLLIDESVHRIGDQIK